MKIAVMGIGNVGGILGCRWLQSGHEVVFGVKDPECFSENIRFVPANPGDLFPRVGRADPMSGNQINPFFPNPFGENPRFLETPLVGPNNRLPERISSAVYGKTSHHLPAEGNPGKAGLTGTANQP